MAGNNVGKKGRVHQGTCIKDTRTKPKGVGWRVGGRDKWGRGHGGGKMETPCLLYTSDAADDCWSV